MSGVAVTVASAALVVLLAVAASGIGPALSLRRTVKRFGDLTEEIDSLRRNLERLAGRAEQILVPPLRDTDGEPGVR